MIHCARDNLVLVNPINIGRSKKKKWLKLSLTDTFSDDILTGHSPRSRQIQTENWDAVLSDPLPTHGNNVVTLLGGKPIGNVAPFLNRLTQKRD